MSKWYVGVDVGKDELVAAVEGRSSKVFANTVAGSKALYHWARKLSSGQPLFICSEATGVYGYLAVAFWHTCPQTEVSVVNPAQIAAFAKAQLRRCKTDQIDAAVIQQFAATQNPPVWQPADTALRQLYELVQLADQLKAQRRQWQNRRHARGYVPDLPVAVTKTHQAIIRSLDRQLDHVDQEIKRLCAITGELAQQVALLTTIPGIAQPSAVQILAYGQNWLTHRTAKQLVAYSGLAPHPKQSGTSLHSSGSIDRRGNVRLRKALYMPALVAVQHNPLLRRTYQRLCQRGKAKKLALVACMKKLLLIARAILRTKIPFNPAISPLT